MPQSSRERQGSSEMKWNKGDGVCHRQMVCEVDWATGTSSRWFLSQLCTYCNFPGRFCCFSLTYKLQSEGIRTVISFSSSWLYSMCSLVILERAPSADTFKELRLCERAGNYTLCELYYHCWGFLLIFTVLLQLLHHDGLADYLEQCASVC